MTPDIPAPMIVGELTLEVAFAPVGITTAVPVTVSLPSSVVANSPVATTKLLPLSSVSPKPEVAITPVGMVVAVPVTVSLPSAVVPCKSFPSIRTVTFDVVATVSLPTAVLACRSSPSITSESSWKSRPEEYSPHEQVPRQRAR